MSSQRRRALFVCLLVVLGVGVLEGASRLLWRLTVSDAVRDHVALLGGGVSHTALMKPSAFWHHDLNPAHPLYASALNVEGTLGADFQMPKPPGELRVLCLGDSTTEGSGVHWSEAYPAQLESYLRPIVERSPGFTSVSVINAGVASHNSAFSLSYLALRLIHFEPDVVVIKSSYNDFLPYIKAGLGFDYANVFPRPFALKAADGRFWALARHSALLRFVGLAFYPDDVGNPYRDYSGDITMREVQLLDWTQNEAHFGLYAENLRSMLLLAKGRGMMPLLLDLPTSPDDAQFSRGFGTPYRQLVARLEVEIERIAREEGVTWVRTGPFVGSDFLDHCHGTAEGNRKIARRVAAAIESWLGSRVAREPDRPDPDPIG